MMEFTPKSIALGCVAIVLLFLLILTPFSIRGVNSGDVGIRKSWGKVDNNIVDGGLVVLVPIQDSLVKIDVRTRKYESQENSATKDLQVVDATVAINYRLPKDKVLEIYTDIGDNAQVEESVIKPAISESVKASISEFTVEENITKREALRDAISTRITNKLDDYGIQVESVSIANLDFSEEFDNAIEAKQVAEQQALKAKFIKQEAEVTAETTVINAQATADATLVKAKADAQAQELLKVSLTNELLQKLYLEKWNGVLPTYMGSGDDSILMNLQ